MVPNSSRCADDLRKWIEGLGTVVRLQNLTSRVILRLGTYVLHMTYPRYHLDYFFFIDLAIEPSENNIPNPSGAPGILARS